MTTLHAFLFESLRITRPGGQPLDLGSPTTRSLIAYLLLNRSHPIDRRRLAFLFWPHVTESAARRNLRQYIHHMRMALAPLDPEGILLQTDGATIRLNPQAEIVLDVETFQQLSHPAASLPELEEALRIYTGDLLEDIYDDWCAEERERLHRLWLEVLDRYSRAQLQAGRLSEALSAAQKWANAEPYDENAIRRLMQIYALSGDRAHAIQVYQTFAKMLADELGAEPLPETQSLARSLQSGDLHLLEADQAELPPQPRLSPTPAVSPKVPLVNRQQEMRQLEELYQQACEGKGKLVLISGEAGVGKTRLIQEYLASHPEVNVHYSICYELESKQPFAPIPQA